jgi:hypothetical protein
MAERDAALTEAQRARDTAAEAARLATERGANGAAEERELHAGFPIQAWVLNLKLDPLNLIPGDSQYRQKETCLAASQKVELIDGCRNSRPAFFLTITAVTRFTLTDIAPSVIGV